MARKVTFIILILLSVFICAELLIRAYDLCAGINGYSHNNLEFLYVPNSYYSYSFRPKAVARIDRNDPKEIRINSLGYRGEEFDPVKPKGACRILCFGGSSTFGVFEKNNAATWPELLERKLQKETKKTIEVINAAGPGYSTFESLSRFINEAINFSPDIVIIYHTINDAYLSGKIKVDSPVNKVRNFYKLHNPVNRVFLHSRFYSLIYSSLQQIRLSRAKMTPSKAADFSFSRRTFERNLSIFVNAAEGENIKVVLATQLIDKAKCPSWLVSVIDDYTAIIKDVAAKYHIRLIDTQAIALAEEINTLLNDEVHFSSAGDEWISNIFAEKIKNEQLLE